MKIGDLLDLVFKEKRIRQRVRTVQKVAVAITISAAVGAGITGILFTLKPGEKAFRNLRKEAANTMDTFKETVGNKAQDVQVTAAHIAKEAGDAIKDVHGKVADVQKDIVDGYHDIKQDAHKTAENIADSVQA